MLRHPRLALGPLADRLRSTPRYQRIIERVHASGPRATAELIVELLEHADADPAILERLHYWERIDPRTVRQIGGDNFPRPPLYLVPRRRRQ